MRTGRFAKGSIAAVLICILALSCAGQQRIYAALAVDTEQKCSITIDIEGSTSLVFPEGVSEEETGAASAALRGLDTIPVKLYQVASISSSGSYTALEDYAGLQDFLKNVSSTTKTEEWREGAQTAAELTEEGDQAAAEISVSNGRGKAEGLSVGLYLVMAETVYDSNYHHEYSFSPYLISLPGNNYAVDGDDTWIYDVSVGLKPEVKELEGDLIIHKNVSAMSGNDGAEGVTSVFRVTAVKEGQTIYSNVVSIRHKQAGQQSVTIGKFPAGTVVTVEEVYDGAGYRQDTTKGEKVQSVAIVPDKAVETGTGTTASLSFTNVPDGTLTGGYGVTNHFVKGEEDPAKIQKTSNVETENRVSAQEDSEDGGTENEI